MGRDGNKSCFACCFSTPTTSSSSSSSAIKLLLFIVPLILVSFIVFVLVPRNSTWALIYSLPPSTSAVAAANSSEKLGAAVHAESSQQVLDFPSRVVKTVDVGGSSGEATLSDSDEVAVNGSASPPLSAIEAVTKFQELVSD